jgi:hypothetical protein
MDECGYCTDYDDNMVERVQLVVDRLHEEEMEEMYSDEDVDDRYGFIPRDGGEEDRDNSDGDENFSAWSPSSSGGEGVPARVEGARREGRASRPTGRLHRVRNPLSHAHLRHLADQSEVYEVDAGPREGDYYGEGRLGADDHPGHWVEEHEEEDEEVEPEDGTEDDDEEEEDATAGEGAPRGYQGNRGSNGQGSERRYGNPGSGERRVGVGRDPRREHPRGSARGRRERLPPHHHGHHDRPAAGRRRRPNRRTDYEDRSHSDQ